MTKKQAALSAVLGAGIGSLGHIGYTQYTERVVEPRELKQCLIDGKGSKQCEDLLNKTNKAKEAVIDLDGGVR